MRTTMRTTMRKLAMCAVPACALIMAAVPGFDGAYPLMPLHKLPQDNGAACLDGTPPGGSTACVAGSARACACGARRGRSGNNQKVPTCVCASVRESLSHARATEGVCAPTA